MIFRVTIKTPDALEDAIKSGFKFHEETEEDNPSIFESNDIDTNESVDSILILCEKWFRHNECVTLEIDTEEKTCIVVTVL
jgi:hypothetical protein